MERITEYLDGLGPYSRTLIVMAFIVLMAIFFTRLIRWIIHRSYNRRRDPSPADATRLAFMKNAVSLIVWFIAIGGIIYTIPKLRSIAVTMFAGAGILIAIIGLAAQQAFANIIGGIFIVIFKPFRVGDFIKVGSLDAGWVEDITLRHTTIKSFQNKRIIIPNSTMSSENIINDTIEDPRVCRWVEVGISYDSDLDQALRILQEECERHPLCIDTRTAENVEAGIRKVIVRVIELGEYAIKLRAFAWADNTVDAVTMHHELNRLIKLRFDEADIEIPFPYRTIVYKKDIPRLKDRHGKETEEK